MYPTPLSHAFRADRDGIGTARRAVVAYAQEHCDAEDEDVALAVSEALTNAVVHGFVAPTTPGTVWVSAHSRSDGGLEVTVIDDGCGPGRRDDSPGLGLGLPLIARLTERMEIRPGDAGGTSVRMIFAVSRS